MSTARHTTSAGDADIRADEELAFNVLRYGKILSRKLENRMQGSSRLRRAAPPSLAHIPAQIKEEHMERLVPLLTTEPPLSCRSASEASRCRRSLHASPVTPQLQLQRGVEHLLRERQRAHGAAACCHVAHIF